MSFCSVIRLYRIAFCVLPATPALAVDLTIKSTASESVEVNDNYFLVPSPKGTTYTSLSSVYLDVLARTPTSRYQFSGDFSYTRYLGPGAADTVLHEVTQNGLNFGFEQSGKAGDKLGLSTSWRRQDLATAQLADIGTVTARGEINTYAVSGNVARQLSPSDELALSAIGTSVSFNSSSVAPYSNLTTSAVWKRQLGPSTNISTSAEFNWTVREDQTHSDTKFWRFMTGVQTRPTSRLTLNGAVGVGVVNASEGAFSVGGAIPQLPLDQTGASASMLADLQAAYKLGRTTQLSVNTSRGITPGVLGDLSQRTSFGMGLTQDINALSSVSVSAQFIQFTAPGGQGGSQAADFWTADVTYLRRITREWRSQLSYTYRQRNDGLHAVNSNAFVLRVARDMTLVP